VCISRGSFKDFYIRGDMDVSVDWEEGIDVGGNVYCLLQDTNIRRMAKDRKEFAS